MNFKFYFINYRAFECYSILLTPFYNKYIDEAQYYVLAYNIIFAIVFAIRNKSTKLKSKKNADIKLLFCIIMHDSTIPRGHIVYL